MDEISQMLDDCCTRSERLNEWESNFIDSLVDKVGDGETLTEKQKARLTIIWEKATKNG